MLICYRLGQRLVRSARGNDKKGVREIGSGQGLSWGQIASRQMKMRELGIMARSAKEKATDQLLTLYLLDDAFSRKGTPSIPDTRLQKLVFLSERAMIDRREKGFNFRFIKLTYGPFSQELEGDAVRLVRLGLLHGRGLEPTEHAKAILEDFHDVIERNNSFTRHIRETNDKFVQIRLDRLLDIIHTMPWGRNRTIDDLPPRTPMLYPMKPQNVAREFSITDEEADDLLMNFDIETVSNLVQAMKEMKTQKLRTHEQLLHALRA